MTFATSLSGLHETALPERVGDGPAERLADVRALVARELIEIESVIAHAIDRGVTPATDSASP